MKKLTIVIALMFVVLGVNAQTNRSTTKTNTGIARLEKGAYWSTDLEGKISKFVYDNIHKVSNGDVFGKKIHVDIVPADNTVQVLFRDFANHNRNWVYLSAGEKIWRYIDGNQWFAATCGNRIAELRTQQEIVKTQIEYRTQYVKPEVVAAPVKLVEESKPQQVMVHRNQPVMQDNCIRGIELLNITIIAHAGRVGNSKRLSYKKAKRRIEILKLQYPDCYKIQDYHLQRNSKDVIKNVLIAGAITTATSFVAYHGVKALKAGENKLNNQNPVTPDYKNPNVPKDPTKPLPENPKGPTPGPNPKGPNTPADDPNPDPAKPAPTTTPTTPTTTPSNPNPVNPGPTTTPPTTDPGPGYNPGGFLKNLLGMLGF